MALTALEGYDQARCRFQDTLQTAIEIDAEPQGLNALVGVAPLLTKLSRVTQATTVLEYVLNHSAEAQQTKDGANHLQLMLNAQIRPTVGGNSASQLHSLEQLVVGLNLSFLLALRWRMGF
jgi:hypothetical protein